MYCCARDFWHRLQRQTTHLRGWSWLFVCMWVARTSTLPSRSAGHHWIRYSARQFRESCPTELNSTENRHLTTHPSLTLCWKDRMVCTDSPGSLSTKLGSPVSVPLVGQELENRSFLLKMEALFPLKTHRLKYLDWQLEIECTISRVVWQ